MEPGSDPGWRAPAGGWTFGNPATSEQNPVKLNTTGIGIHGAATGITGTHHNASGITGTNAAGTGLAGTNGAATGITLQGSGTGIGVHASGTGLSTTNNTGSGAAVPIVQPSLGLRFALKT